jgi:hypothetical protein
MGKVLDIVKQLNAVEFDWKTTNQHDIGLIAEDVEKVIPEAVWYVDGKIEGLKPLTLIAVLVEAIKELSMEV